MTPVRFRPAAREERQLAALWAAAAVSAILLRPVLLAVAPMLRPCVFRSLTGLPCPSCGTTRTAEALLNLDFTTAFVTSPLAAAIGVFFFVGGVAALLWLLLRWPMISIGLRWSRWWTVTVMALVIANWAYLIATH